MAVKFKTKTKTKAKPVKSKPVEEDDEDYEEAEDEDYEEEKPKKIGKKKPRAKSDDDDDDDDDEEDSDDNDALLKGGWGAHHRNKAETSNFPNKLELKPDPALVMFLEDAPVASYKQHWIERDGKKSFFCIGQKECPLCATGDKPKVQNVFNLVRLDEGEPVNLVLQTGVKLTDIIEGKTHKAPLTKGYWSIGRTGKGGTTNFEVSRVKERDLEDDWSVEPLDDDVIKKFRTTKWKASDTVNISNKKELREIAREMVGDADDDDDDD